MFDFFLTVVSSPSAMGSSQPQIQSKVCSVQIFLQYFMFYLIFTFLACLDPSWASLFAVTDASKLMSLTLAPQSLAFSTFIFASVAACQSTIAAAVAHWHTHADHAFSAEFDWVNNFLTVTTVWLRGCSSGACSYFSFIIKIGKDTQNQLFLLGLQTAQNTTLCFEHGKKAKLSARKMVKLLQINSNYKIK